MCGVIGVVDLARVTSAEALCGLAETLAARLVHRGPDDAGTWADPDLGVALGHRRLAIVDLTQHGHQPMVSASGRFVLAYNGEVYNHQELRAELESAGHRFRGSSDTEVLVEMFDRHGVASSLRRVDGMLAVVVVDRVKRRLHAAVDRFGEKPLYWGYTDDRLILASEIGVFLSLPNGSPVIDRAAVAAYMRRGCVPSGLSVLRGVSRLEAATLLTVDLDASRSSGTTPKRVKYWDALEEAIVASREQRPRTLTEAADQVEEALTNSVRRRLMADVPLGAFLSGGIDSSLVVATMRRAGAARVRTFTIGFDDPTFDESSDARRIAAHLHTEHTEMVVTAGEALAVIPRVADVYGEPFADASQIPTMLVSELARRSVTVALSGDGGDELFGGYNRHGFLEWRWPRVQRVPVRTRGAVARAIASSAEARLERLTRPLLRALPDGAKRNPSAKLHKLGGVLDAGSAGEVYDRLTSEWEDVDGLVIGAPDQRADRGWDRVGDAALSDGERAMIVDTLTYLPDDILVKLDRASMAVSLETRAPFLEPTLFSVAWGLPIEHRIGRRAGKVVLREVLARSVPRSMFERPKTGFDMPLGRWLRGPLRGWAEDLLSAEQLRASGVLTVEPVRRAWTDHLSGRADRSHELWNALVLQAWLIRTGLR